MGFDLYGEHPTAENGGYFRNNVWWWRPLWQYVVLVCEDVLTKKDAAAGHLNNGHLIHARAAKAVAQRLSELLASGEVKQYAADYRARLNALPLAPCAYCQGTGTRDDQHVKGQCNGCKGRGECAAWATHYPFSEANVREFAEFCARSGGFKIC